MSEWETLVETMARASDDTYEHTRNGIRALNAAGYAIVPRRAIPGKIFVDKLIKLPTHEEEYEYYVAIMEVKPDA